MGNLVKRGQTDRLRRVFAAAAAGLALLAGTTARASGQTSETAGEFWPAIDFHMQLSSNLRLLTFAGLKNGEDSPYEQVYVGTGLGYQFKRFTKPHLANIDPDKENFLVAGAGYEYLRTIQPGEDQEENRIIFQGTPRFRPPADFLLSDRNRIEFRWVNGDYSTRYRNMFTVERDFLVSGFRFTTYASAEFFYDIEKGSWNKEQYAGGFLLPYKNLLNLGLYYLRQNCSTCSPAHLNVAGLTVSLYLGSR
jgi:hypothetical protein